MPCVHVVSKRTWVEREPFLLQTSNFLGYPEYDKEGHCLGTRSPSSHKRPQEPTRKLWRKNITSQAHMNLFLPSLPFCEKFFQIHIFVPKYHVGCSLLGANFSSISVGWIFTLAKSLREEFILSTPPLHQCPPKQHLTTIWRNLPPRWTGAWMSFNYLCILSLVSLWNLVTSLH